MWPKRSQHTRWTAGRHWWQSSWRQTFKLRSIRSIDARSTPAIGKYFFAKINSENQILTSRCICGCSNRFKDLRFRADCNRCHHYHWSRTGLNKVRIIAWWAVRPLGKCRTWSHTKSNNEWWSTSNCYKIPKNHNVSVEHIVHFPPAWECDLTVSNGNWI